MGGARVSPLPPQALGLLWHQQKYAQPGELTPADTQGRVAQALAQAEPLAVRQAWARRFESAMRRGLLPGGRIMAGAGAGCALSQDQAAAPPAAPPAAPSSARWRTSLMNCFVLPAHDLQALWPQLRATLRAGGGVGLDLSPQPHGVLQALDQCEAVARSLDHVPRAARRAAQMVVLRADHSEIEAFIHAPSQAYPHLTRAVALHAQEPPGLLARVAQAAWASGEPSVLFTQRMQDDDNLGDREALWATNPCGEQPLPPYGACALASIDLTRVVQQPFSPQAHVAWGVLAALAHTGVRLLDNALDISHWPLRHQQREMQRHRRIGLGITGLGDALALLNLHYAAPQARRLAAQIMRFVSHAAYRASVRLARERGAYPGFNASTVLQPPRFASRLPADLRYSIRRHGLRHSHLLALAPAASISAAFADQVSTGVEPMVAPQWQRHWCDPQGQPCSAWVQPHAYRRWMALHGLPERVGRGAGGAGPALRAPQPPNAPLVPAWAWLSSVSPEHQLAMVAALAPHVDGAISKTVSVPQDTSPAAIEALMRSAWHQGLKGVSVYRRGSRPEVFQANPTESGRAACGWRGPGP
ncbi:MAG: hypothetical protein RI972_1990 [Pseudomonadota bacterium]